MTFDFSEFKNKKIIVTGSSTGIGFETGVEFLNLGANVIFHGNQSINDLEARIKSKSPTIPISIGEEKKTNIFLRCNEPSIKNALNLDNASEQEIFSKLRDLKDNF